MKQTNWYKDAVIYQIYPRSFQDSNGDGIGDLNGITSRLDYLKDLGINCVWLSPIYESPMDDNGYDISDYRAIHPMFGTMEDFDRMLKEMHKRGIRLIMDLVVNHTSDEHPWFKASRSSENNEYRDYYIWRKSKNDKAPNNWTGFFGDKAWQYDMETDSYYLHLFSRRQPDLNWENPKVRQEVKDIIKFWCDKGVDGFRCDVITLISKDQRFKNGNEFLLLKGRHQFVNGPRLHAYLHELNEDILSKYDVMTVGETVMSSVEEVKKLTDENRKELSMVFNFDHTSVDCFFGVKWFMRKFSLRRWKKALDTYQDGLDKIGWNSLFYENHDQRRSVGRFNTDDKVYREKSAKMLATSIYLLKGTPFIYQGQEIGMTNADIDILDDYQDIETHNIYETAVRMHLPKSYINKTIKNGSRDNARTPMQWDSSEFAGFSKCEPWLKVNSNKEVVNVRECSEDPDSILNYMKKLLEFRKNEPLIRDGSYVDLMPTHNKIYAYLRIGANYSIMVIANYSATQVTVDIPTLNNSYEIMLNNYPVYQMNMMEPYQAVVLKLKH